MCAMEPNLVQTPFFLAPKFFLKAASLHSVKHRSITLHSYFGCKSLHWSLESPIYPSKFELSHHHQYWFVANTPAVVFIFLVARLYIISFVLRRETLILPKKTFSQLSEVQLMYVVHQAPAFVDVRHLPIALSS